MAAREGSFSRCAQSTIMVFDAVSIPQRLCRKGWSEESSAVPVGRKGIRAR